MKSREELEVENCELKQEIRGLKKQLNKYAPLFIFNTDFANCKTKVQVRNPAGSYDDFIVMSFVEGIYNDEVKEMYYSILGLFKEHGYD